MFEALKSKLEGPFYTVFTPFDQNYKVDYGALEKYLNHLYSGGARRFYTMAYNSRYSQMSHAEIKELNRFCAKHLKSLDKENIVIVGDPIHCSTEESLEFTLDAKESGADIISLLVREKYFSDDQILDHYDYIGRKSDFPLLVHEMPFLSGFDGSQMHWPKSLLKRLPEIKHIVALKEGAKDYETTFEALRLEPEIKVILAGGGKRRFLDFYKNAGAKSWLNGISIIDARIAERFWEACQRNDEAYCQSVIEKLEVPFFDNCPKKYGWHRTNKALLEAAGLMSRRDRMPLQQLNDIEFQEVKAVYREIQQNLKMIDLEAK